KAPFTIEKILTDNGKEFTDRFCATGEREPTGHHLFDQGCADHSIEHRLTAPRHPQTNGMVERFNGRIAEVLATTRFDSSQNLADTLNGYVRLYNHQIPQKALGHIAPIQALKDWQQQCPERFKKRVYNLAGLDIREIQLIATGTGIRDLTRLNRQYGRGKWRKSKGFAAVRLLDGTVHTAEIHWYEAHGIGKKEFKLKLPLLD
ncbi:Integrase core domain-containing protein, partial [Allochromatium warmingii]